MVTKNKTPIEDTQNKIRKESKLAYLIQVSETRESSQRGKEGQNRHDGHKQVAT